MIHPDLQAALNHRYADRPATLAAITANAEAWQRLQATSHTPAHTNGKAAHQGHGVARGRKLQKNIL